MERGGPTFLLAIYKNVKYNCAMPKVTCPCCHGTCWNVIYDLEKMEIVSREPCAHCEGTGEIEAEVEEPKED